MKHNWKVLALILCLMLLMPLALGACGGSGSDDPAKAIIGTWTDQDELMEYEFKDGGFMVLRFMGEEIEMPFTIDGSKLSVTDPETDEVNDVDFRIEEDNLILSFDGEEETLVRKK